MRVNIDVTSGKRVFFISDFHLYHLNVIKFDKRPFLKPNGEGDLEKMHSTIINNWNNTVRQHDEVFYLGDLCFGTWEQASNIVFQLSGKIHYIMGNHDKYEDIKKIGRFVGIYDYVDLFLHTGEKHKTHFTLMHYPIFSPNRAHHGSYHVHGHCHGNLHHGEDRNYYVNRRAIDVGCNLIDYTPISYEDVINKLGKIEIKKH